MLSPKLLLIIITITAVQAEESRTQSSLLGPKHFNYHPYENEQYLREINPPDPTRQGPVLFPNDAPPPPRPPLIVTSRPIAESIARSELNPTPNPKQETPNNYDIQNLNSITRQSQFKPKFLARLKDYQAYSFSPTPNYETRNPKQTLYVNPVTGRPVNPYVEEDRFVKKNFGRNYGLGKKIVNDPYEVKPTLPPIYKVLSDYAENKLKHRQKNKYAKPRFEVKEPTHHLQDPSNYLDDDDDERSENDENSNYAFSYIVKDKSTGDDFSHTQQSVGSATNGEYRVRLPDGRMQIVSYTADENGYKADVRYDDEVKSSTNIINNDNSHNEYKENNNNNHEDVKSEDSNSNSKSFKNNYKSPNYYHSNDVYYNDNKYDVSNNNDINQYDASKQYDNPTYNEISPTPNYYSPYTENSKEDYHDYSLEYNGKYDTYPKHNNKFVNIVQNPQNFEITPRPTNTAHTVTPSYEELKNIFLKQNPLYNNAELYKEIPVEINVPSTTPQPNIDTTTERVVLIGGKQNLFTNVHSTAGTIPYVSTQTTFIPNYIVSSTLPPLQRNIDYHGDKPVLSASFIDRINKYLTF